MRDQIDFITINEQFRKGTIPGADATSDHVPVVTIIKFKLKLELDATLGTTEKLDIKIKCTGNRNHV